MGEGVVAGRVSDQPGEQCRLGRRELTDVLPEKVLGSGAHAVGALTEVNGVEVALQDLVLRELALEPDRERGLFHLAPDVAP